MPTHAVLGRGIGIANEEMAALAEWESSDVFDARDRLVLQFTDALCRTNTIDDELYGALEEYFSKQAIVKLSFMVGLAGMVNRVHATFRTTVDATTAEGAIDTPFCVLDNT